MRRAPTPREEGERERLRHSLERLDTAVKQIVMVLDMPGGPALDDAGALMTTATEVTTQIAKLVAFKLAADDAADQAAKERARVERDLAERILEEDMG